MTTFVSPEVPPEADVISDATRLASLCDRIEAAQRNPIAGELSASLKADRPERTKALPQRQRPAGSDSTADRPAAG